MNKKKELRVPSGPETLFIRDKVWMRDTLLIPMIRSNNEQIERIKEGLERSSKCSSFNMVEPYIDLMEMINETNDKIKEFYSKIRWDENFKGKPYKLKDYER